MATSSCQGSITGCKPNKLTNQKRLYCFNWKPVWTPQRSNAMRAPSSRQAPAYKRLKFLKLKVKVVRPTCFLLKLSQTSRQRKQKVALDFCICHRLPQSSFPLSHVYKRILWEVENVINEVSMVDRLLWLMYTQIYLISFYVMSNKTTTTTTYFIVPITIFKRKCISDNIK